MNHVDVILRTEALSAGYQGKPLTEPVSFPVSQGEILALIGPNGAGKSTILKTIARQLKPLGGQVWLKDTLTDSIPAGEMAKSVASVLTARPSTEWMSCQEVVSLGRYPYTGRMGILSEQDRAIVREAMAMVNITDLAQQDFNRISDGQKQRVILARAICQQPSVMILDEPTAYLDIRYKQELMTVLRRLTREKGIAVIMSVHELDLAQKCADRLLCVGGGRIRLGTPEEIFRGDYIEKLYQMLPGSFSAAVGSPELERATGRAEVLVMAGCGTGIPVYRQLQREGIPFRAGPVWLNDLDALAAKSLSADMAAVEPFCEVSTDQLALMKQWIDQSSRVLLTLSPDRLRGQAAVMLELADHARAQNKLEQAWAEEESHGV